MDRFTLVKKLGEGAFGIVFLGVDKSSGAERAVKTLRGTYSWDTVRKLRELQSLIGLPKHRNVVQLYELQRDLDGTVHFIFEYMEEGSLHDLIERRVKEKLGPTPEEQARILLHQLLLGVHHLHEHGVIHRDVKPENILLANESGKLVCKVADFSIARHQSESEPVTKYVATRWYRAPEILLCATEYAFGVDIWAIGCIAYELYTNVPLFPGKDETDQLRLIFSCLGTPELVGWRAGAQLLRHFGIDSWPTLPSPAKILQHQSKMNHENAEVSDFLRKLLQLDPVRRLTSTRAMQHELFCGKEWVAENEISPTEANVGSGNLSHTTPVGRVDSKQRSSHLVTFSPRPADVTSMNDGPGTSQEVEVVAEKRHLFETEKETSADGSPVNPYLIRKQRKNGRYL